ncbi:MAG: MFS transporter [Bryobacteraceae bacterium]
MHSLRIWAPAFSMMLVSLISYIDRNTLAILAPTILADLHLNNQQYGLIIAGFSIAYMLTNPLWGRWLDRFGLRKGMTAAVSFWTLASLSHAFAGGFASLAVARIALGFGEGATFPGGLRTVVQTLPAIHRSKGIALAYSGGALGALVTPLIVTPIAVVWGWQGAFWFTGLVGAAWLAVWLGVSRDLRESTPAADPEGKPHWTDPRLWSFIFSYSFGALPLGFVLYSASIYLKWLGKTQVEIGQVLWIPPLGWELGYLFWGWLVDRALRGSRAPMSVYRTMFTVCVVLSLPLAVATRIPSFPLLLAELFLAMFCTAGFLIVGVSYATSVFSARYSGFIAGVGAGSWSGLVAIVMPVAGWLFDRQRFEAAFVMAAAFPVAGYLLWRWTPAMASWLGRSRATS